jgi:hypothetical protein
MKGSEPVMKPAQPIPQPAGSGITTTIRRTAALAGALLWLLALGFATQAIADDEKEPAQDAHEQTVDQNEAGARPPTRSPKREPKRERDQTHVEQRIQKIRENSAKQAANARARGDEERAQRIEENARKRIEKIERRAQGKESEPARGPGKDRAKPKGEGRSHGGDGRSSPKPSSKSRAPSSESGEAAETGETAD